MKKSYKILVALGMILLIGIIIPKLTVNDTVVLNNNDQASGVVLDDMGAVVATDSFPPNGWYAHQVSGFDGMNTILTRTEELPRSSRDNYRDGDNISITDRRSALTPEEYVEKTKNVSDSALKYATWSSFYGHKIFRMGFTNENGSQARQYLFGGDHAYIFTLYPDKQENRQAFQDVINHYASDPSLEKIPRDETLRNCMTTTFEKGKEKNTEVDSETGYVTVGYTKNGVQTHAYFNYNDDLSQCAPDVRDLLSGIKIGVDKKNADQCVEMKNILSGKESFPSTTDEQHRQAYISLAKEFIKNNCRDI